MDDGLIFRSGTAGDAARVRALVREAYGRWVPLIGREPMPMTQDYDAALAAHRFRLGFAGDELVAVLEYVARAGFLWIENVAVKPSWQGRGIGKAQLLWAEAEARRLGLGEMRLLTNERFEANVRLYQRMGYAITDRQAYLEGFTVFLAKPLA